MKKSIIFLMLMAVWAGAASAAGHWRGDLNGDDRVDMADMVFLANAIKSGSSDKDLDLNASGKVDDYDLDALANIILSGQLTENSGLNVGIGGWDDSGEDYGGTVNAPAYPGTRSAESSRFYIGNPKEVNGQCSIDFGIEEADATAAGFLFNIRLPRELSFDDNNTVTLDGAALDGHRLYGNARITQQDEWSDKTLRFIVFSKDLNPLKITKGVLGQLHYGCNSYNSMAYYFEDCQMIIFESKDVVTPELSFNWISWKPIEVSSIWFDITEMELYKGDQRGIYANIDPWDATDRSLTWTSSDSAVVSVTPDSEYPQNASIRALKAGNAVITCTTSNGLTATCNVVVKQDAEGITIDKFELNLTLGGDPTLAEGKLTATVLPQDASDKTINWFSQNDGIATVDQEGNVTAQHAGEVDIIAQTNMGHQAICHVFVTQLATGITLDQTDVTLRLGESINLYAEISPYDTSDKKVNWSSSDAAVASVDADGLVRGLAVGEATITATAADGSGMTATAVVRVLPVLAEAISIDGMPQGDIRIGDNFRLTATVYPENTTDKSVTWTSSDSGVVSVDANGLVRAIAVGEATITATAADGSGVSAQVMVNVKPNLADRIVIDPSESEIRIGESIQLTATIYPDNATDKKVDWSSSDAAVASVDADGLVRGLAVGEATITATAADGSGMTATAIVRVLPILVENIVIEGIPEGEIKVGDKFRLRAVVYPEEATDTSVSWSSDNGDVASVDADGNVEILAEGSTVVRATANDGSGCQALCYIDVVSGVEMLIDAGKPFRVYDINGHLLLKEATQKDLGMLTKGIYILVQGNNTCKFIR